MATLKTITLSLTLLTTFLFFLLNSPNYPSPSSTIPRRSLLSSSTNDHHRVFSLISLSLLLLFLFYLLIKTAQDHFSLVATRLVVALDLTPSVAAVTLLALGNGAPDVFASLAAVRRGNYRTGFGAILSAGTFVSAFVVGFVAIHAAPFALDPATFVRDAMFYLIAALFLFYVYLSAEIYLWQAVGFVGFYLFFVGFVFYMDMGLGRGGGKRPKSQVQERFVEVEIGEVSRRSEDEKPGFGFRGAFGMVCLC